MPRIAQPVDLRLLCKVSRLYYESNLTEREIAHRLQLSRPKVSRLLKQARAEGIVQIGVLSPPGVYPDLEDRLERRFELQEAIVVEASDVASQEGVSREVGAAAARHLQETLGGTSTVGLSWGRTLQAMVASLRPQRRESAHVVQIIGGLGEPTAESHATGLCRRIASILNCRLTLLPAPGIMSSRQSKEALLSDSHVQAALKLIAHIDVAYVGIGVAAPSSVLMRDGSIISGDELATLTAQGAVGDIALRFFDGSGRPIRSDVDERVIGVSLEQLKQIPRVVGVAGGPQKEAVIRGALLGGYVDVLITDQGTAERLLA